MPLANGVYPEFRGNNGLQWLGSEVLDQGPYARVGNVWYVDAVNGSDTFGGQSASSAFKSLYAAHTAATSNNYDVIVVAPSGIGTSSSTDESVAISGGLWTFSKNLITVIGSSSPTAISPRSRILWKTAGQSTGSTPLLTISGGGNSFINLQFGSFVDNNVLVQVTGARNYFGSVHFAGIGDDTTGDDTAARSLVLSAASECRFVDCTIGLDTVTRSTTNASLELTGSCDRNRFEHCVFPAYCDNAGALFIKAVTGNCYERFVVFEDCLFLNAVDGSSTTMTAGISNAGTGNGLFLLKDCWMRGATDTCSTSYVNVYTTNPVPGTANQTFPTIVAT